MEHEKKDNYNYKINMEVMSPLHLLGLRRAESPEAVLKEKKAGTQNSMGTTFNDQKKYDKMAVVDRVACQVRDKEKIAMDKKQ